MSMRAFVLLIVGWGVGLGLAATPVGAILGFFVGVAMAFFVAPLVFLLHVPQESVPKIGWALLWALGLLVLTLLVWGGLDWRRGDMATARGRWAWGISLVAAVLVLKLSAASLVAAWH